MDAVRILCVAILSAVSVFGSDFATSYKQAVALADAQEKALATRNLNKVLLQHYAQTYGPVLQTCFATVTQPDNTPFSFVAAIASDGSVVRVFNDRETNISRCLLSHLKNGKFPTPPESPYYLHVEMKFSDDPPARPASSYGAPPLIVSPKKYSYTFGVPAGWEFNFEQAHQRGAALAYFPRGRNFDESSSVIYVNEIGDSCGDNCMPPLSASITQTLHDVKADSPAAEINAEEPIPTKDGAKASIRIVKGAHDPRDPESTDTEALAFIGHEETTILIVLSTRDPERWDLDYSAFRQIVEGHRFFTCNSPDLAVPCRK
jgi:hypothetical protein